LFSKKKSDLLIETIEEDVRSFFRVEPSSKEPIDASVGRHRYPVVDISAEGMRIYRNSHRELEIGEEYPFNLPLPLINEVISGMIRVVDISHMSYQCVFLDLDPEEIEKIHLFTLERQKVERRAFSRVAPSHKLPIRLSIGSHVLQIKDMGAGGVAAYRGKEKDLEVKKEYPFKIPLPLIDELISGTIRIVDISSRTYQCAFVNLDRKETDKIHRFILEMQKQEGRAFFRIKPSRKDPIQVFVEPHTFLIKDIGAGGMAVYKDEGKILEINKEYPFKLPLPLIDEMISGIMRIVNISEKTYHCVYIDLTQEHREKIHLFVLERQKEELREKKKTSSAFKGGILTAQTIPFPEGPSR
jgi:c-di-GMP-binding flagellar brake protein YcgR